jgi:hypothetical protein
MKKLCADEFFTKFSQFEVYMDGSYDSNIASAGIAFIKDEYYSCLEKAVTYTQINGSSVVNDLLPGEDTFLSCYFAEFYAFYELINTLKSLQVTNKWQLVVNTDNKGLANTFSGKDPWLMSWLGRKWKRADKKTPEQTPLLKKIMESLLVYPNIDLSDCPKDEIYKLGRGVFGFQEPCLNKEFISVKVKFIFREQQRFAHDLAYNYMLKIRRNK